MAYKTRQGRRQLQHTIQNIIVTAQDEQATRPEFVENYRRALVDVSHEMDDLNHIEIIQRFDSDIALSLDLQATVNEWRAWFREFDDAVKARDKAIAELAKLDETSAGSIGWWMAVDDATMDRDEAQAVIDRLKDGPVAERKMVDVDESGQPFDDNYLPF